MKKDEWISEVAKWDKYANEKQCYDVALFKIWIKFEVFISELFELYATGNPSELDFSPNLRIAFEDTEHLNVFLREGNKPYIDYYKCIETYADAIFSNNPFDALFKDANFSTVLNEVTALRNYIAHESQTSKKKVVDIIFSGNAKKFKEPNEYLLTIKKPEKITKYSYYIKVLIDIVDFLLEPF